MAARKRTYPDTPAGHVRAMRDGEDAYLARLGHRMTWTRGHGVRWLKGHPGYRGRCELCGGVARLAWLGGTVGYSGYEGAMEKQFLTGPRRCTVFRRYKAPDDGRIAEVCVRLGRSRCTSREARAEAVRKLSGRRR